MALIVENGAGLPDAQRYVDLDAAAAYATVSGLATWQANDKTDEDRSAALIRATRFIDATYRGRFPGYPAHGRAQALEWPRVGAYVVVPDNGRSDALYDAGGRGYAYLNGVYQIPANEVPREMKAAVCEAAARELAKPGSLAPDLKRGGAIKSAGAGSARVEFFGGAPATTTFQALDLALGALLMPASPFSGRAARG